MALARHGATADGGVDRQALSPEERSTWRELIDWASELGLRASTDAAGNLFLRLDGAQPELAPVLSGSHLDSQPTGGRFDGVYGVLAALEAVQAIVESGTRLRRPIEIVAWMNEEGSRFVPGMTGSAAFTGAMALDDVLALRDGRGFSMAEGLAALHSAFRELPLRELPRPVASYVEAHIEQGPVLEREGYPVGVVTGIQGKRTFRVTVRGEEAHAGTSTRRERKDALLAATRMIQALAAMTHDDEDVTRFTVGRLDVMPNAPSVVPAQVVFSIDLRHVESAVLARLGDRVAEVCAAEAPPCSVEVAELTSAMSLRFPEAMTGLIRDTARALGIRAMDIHSAAGHDARFLHRVCPTGMIFVPCAAGISHSPRESAKPDDLAAGARVLVTTLVALANA
jgi:N-carbamoyl-L-amino-acid hydrolase